MTKPLDPDEKKRRAEERDAIKAGEQSGKTAAQVMSDLQRKRVDEARQALDAQEAAKEPERAAQRERERVQHQLDMQEQSRRQVEIERRQAEREAAKRLEEANKSPQQIAGEPLSQKLSDQPVERKGKGRSILRTPGYARCPGSTLNVEEANLVLVGGKNLRDDNPWDYRGKRVLCPECGHSVGVSPFGKHKETQPTGYRIDTHYRKAVV